MVLPTDLLLLLLFFFFDYQLHLTTRPPTQSSLPFMVLPTEHLDYQSHVATRLLRPAAFASNQA